jgi:hypothetical protein
MRMFDGCQRKTVCRTTHKNSVVLYWYKKCVVTQRPFRAHFQTDGRLHSKQFIKFITSLITMVQCWRGIVAGLQLCVLRRTLTLQRSPSKSTRKAAAQLEISWRSVQRILKAIWICIHKIWQCCRNLQFKTNSKEWHLLNGLRIMRYRAAMLVFWWRTLPRGCCG